MAKLGRLRERETLKNVKINFHLYECRDSKFNNFFFLSMQSVSLSSYTLCPFGSEVASSSGYDHYETEQSWSDLMSPVLLYSHEAHCLMAVLIM